MQIIEITYYGQLAVVSSSCPASLPSPASLTCTRTAAAAEPNRSPARAACNKAAFKCCSQTAEAVAEVFFCICFLCCCCCCLMCAGWVAPVRLSAISHLPSASHLAPEAAAAQSQQYQLGRSAATAHKFIRSLWQLPRLCTTHRRQGPRVAPRRAGCN